MGSQHITSPEEIPADTTRVGALVAWGWMDFGRGPEIYVWHWCDHQLWAGREGYDAHPEDYTFWVPGGVAAHTVVSTEPLHLEPSVYWPDCCGMHGWIRGGRWVSA